MGSDAAEQRNTNRENHCMGVKKERATLYCVVCLYFVSTVRAQELEPRAYWITPKAANAIYLGYTFLDGEVVFHPLLPFEEVDARLNSAFLGYCRALDFFGRSANFTVTLPYVRGTEEGLFLKEFHRARLSGLADLQLRFSANLIGAKSMTSAEFLEFREDPGTILGASFRVHVPSGKYSSSRLVNVGSNRWAFRSQMGLIQPIRKRFLIELALG